MLITRRLDLVNGLSRLDSFQIPDLHLRIEAVITAAEESGFIAHDPRTGTTTQGESVEGDILGPAITILYGS
jgi:hypothetical protein